jgi:molybdenum cofactor cytidylyltransferase
MAGVPVFFSRVMYPELLAVAPHKGARGLIQQFPEKIHSIPFPKAGLDVETPDDYQNILARDDSDSQAVPLE